MTDRFGSIYNRLCLVYNHLLAVIKLQTLLNKGVKYMLVQGHPATGCLTLSMSLAPEDDRDKLGCVQSANNQSYTHNLALQSTLKQLRSAYMILLVINLMHICLTNRAY